EGVGTRLGSLEQLVHVDAIPRLGRDPPGRGVRVRQQPEPLELGELAPDGRGRDFEPRPLDERPRADGLSGRDVLLDEEAEHLALGRLLARRQRLELTLRTLPAGTRRQVAVERRGVPPAPVLDCADRAHAEAEVVATEPVAEVVPRAQVPTARAVGAPAEV